MAHNFRMHFPGPSDWPMPLSPDRPQTVDAWDLWQQQVTSEIGDAKWTQRLLYVWGTHVAPYVMIAGAGSIWAEAGGFNPNGGFTYLALIVAYWVHQGLRKSVIPKIETAISRREAGASNAAKVRADAYRTVGFAPRPNP